MRTNLPQLLLALLLLVFPSCATKITPRFTGRVINGQVYLSQISKPDALIGPFVKLSATEYSYDDHSSKGPCRLRRTKDGSWWCWWRYLHGKEANVDGHALPND